MQISPISPAQPTTSTNPQDQPASVLSSDFETFLQMLTAQARYQDPLEPIDSSEYAAQLAQFSMVEQQVLSNDLLTALGTQLGTSNMGQMAAWIGMEARSSAPAAFDGAPVTIAVNPAAGADQAFALVHDESGQEVARIQVPLSAEQIEWDGTLADGSIAEPGVFHFSLESRSLGNLLGTTPAESYAKVTEARRENGETVLILQGGAKVGASAISALRAPS
jgi:flagellar basal-body rod modification protein FlgD